MNYVLYIIAFLIAVSFLVLIHEFGHFIVARLFGVKVERFSIGFGKPLCKWRNKTSQIEYVIAPILLGGYVKFLDSDNESVLKSELHLTFNHKQIWQKFLIVVAGALANIVFALFAFWMMFVVGIREPKPIIGKVEPNSIASQVGLFAGEEIIKIDKKTTKNWGEVVIAMIARVGDSGFMNIITREPIAKHKHHIINLQKWKVDDYQINPLEDFGIVAYEPLILSIVGEVGSKLYSGKPALQRGDCILEIAGVKVDSWQESVKLIKKLSAQTVNLLVMRSKNIINIVVSTDWQFGANWKLERYLDIKPLAVIWPENMIREVKYNSWFALQAAWHKMSLFVKLNFIVVSKLLEGKLSFYVLGGPLAILIFSGQALKHGLVMFLNFLAIISLSLAFLNLLPLPGLDGGNAVLLLIEAIRRKPVSAKMQILIARLGIILFMILIVQVMGNDLMRIFA